MAQFYTYIHYRPDGSPFYVGKGKGNRSKIGTQRNRYYQFIIEKYGKDNITIEIINTDSEEAAFIKERSLIKQFSELGFKLSNLTDGGEGTSGYKHSEEANRKNSLSHIGKLHTEETKRRISEAGKGRKLSPEHRQALLKALIGHVGWYAKTPEALARQRDTRRGVKNTPEHNAKITASKMGHEVSEEQREKQRKAMTGRKQSPESIAKQLATKRANREAKKLLEQK